MKKKTITTLICIFILLFVQTITVSADYDFSLEEENATVASYYLYNYENNIVMAQKDIHSSISPSSTAKMMTACVALDLARDMDESVTVTKNMISGVRGRIFGIESGERLTVSDLLYLTVCGGYNDSAQVLAYFLCGSLSDFVEKMNEKAIELGMSSTTYKNVTGMDGTSAVTSVNDIIKLSDHLLSIPSFVEIASSENYTLSDGSFTVKNRSSLLKSYKGITALNTGSGESGDCCVHYYKKDGLSYLCIVMNALAKGSDDEKNYAISFSDELLSHALLDYSYKTILTKEDAVGTSPLLHNVTYDKVELFPASDVTLFIPDNISEKTDLSYNYYTFEKEIKAPVKEGQILGKLLICYDGNVIGSVDLVSSKYYSGSFFLAFMSLIESYVLSRYFLFSLVSFVILMGAYYIYSKNELKKIHRSSKRKK